MSAARHLSTALLATVGLLLATVVVAPAAAAAQSCSNHPGRRDSADVHRDRLRHGARRSPRGRRPRVGRRLPSRESPTPSRPAVTRVSFWWNGTYLLTDFDPAYGLTWRTTRMADGDGRARRPRPHRRRARLRGAGAGHGWPTGSARRLLPRSSRSSSAPGQHPRRVAGSGWRPWATASTAHPARRRWRDRSRPGRPTCWPTSATSTSTARRSSSTTGTPAPRATGSSGPSPTRWSGTTSTRHPVPRGTSSTGEACRTTTATTWPAGTSSPWTPARGSASCGRAPRSTSGWQPTSVRTGRAARWCTCTTRATPSPPTKVAPSSDASGRCSPPAG